MDEDQQAWVVDVPRGCFVAGVVARDHMGNFIAARCSKYPMIVNPYTIELLARRDAVLLAMEVGEHRTKTVCQSLCDD